MGVLSLEGPELSGEQRAVTESLGGVTVAMNVL